MDDSSWLDLILHCILQADLIAMGTKGRQRQLLPYGISSCSCALLLLDAEEIRHKSGLLTRHPLFALGFQCCFACVCLLFLLEFIPWLFCCLGELCQIPEKKRSKGFGNQGSQKRQRLQQGTKGCWVHTCRSLQLLFFFGGGPGVICSLRHAVTLWQRQWLPYRSLKESTHQPSQQRQAQVQPSFSPFFTNFCRRLALAAERYWM